MKEYGKKPNVEDCTCPGRSHHYIGCFSDVVFNSCWNKSLFSLVLTLMGMLPGDCTDGRSMGRT